MHLTLLGTGAIAHHHARTAHALWGNDLTLVAADPSPAARSAFAAAFPWATVLEDPAAALARDGGPAAWAVVCTPPWLHAAGVEAAFAAGRHVVCEKPLGISAADLDRIQQAWQTSGRQLLCCSGRFLLTEATRQVRQLVASGVVGQPYHVVCRHREARNRCGIEYQPASRWFLDRRRAGGGCLLDWGVYDLATVCSVLDARALTIRDAWTSRPTLGPELPAEVVCDVESDGGATLLAELPDGSTCRIDWLRASGSHGSPERHLEVIGNQGALRWDWLHWHDGGQLAVELRSDDGLGGLRQERRILPESDTSGCHAAPLQQVAALVAGQPLPAMHGARALALTRAILAAYDCAADGQPRRIVLPV
jgi:predicted dehydrogenase